VEAGITPATDSQQTTVDATVGGYTSEFTWEVRPFGPLPVRAELDEDGSILVIELLTTSYGVGASMSAALDALSAAVTRQYHFLRREGRAGLSDRLFGQLQALEALRQIATNRTQMGPMKESRQLSLAA